MKRSAFLFLLLLVSRVAAQSGDRPKITTSQGKELVLASLTAQQRRLPKLGADRLDAPYSSSFWFFTVTWEGLPKGSVVVGNYAVDPYTGDVFSAVASCYEMHTSTLQNLQRQTRATLHLSQPDYDRLKTQGPLCEK